MELRILMVFLAVQVLLLKAQRSPDREREIVRTFLEDYDPLQRPSSDGSSSFSESGASIVQLTMYMRSMGPLNTKDMELNTDITLRQKWLDPRLKYDGRTIGDLEYVHVPLDSIWKPNTFIRNEKESSTFFDVPSKAAYLRVFPDGSVLYSVRIKSTIHCLMDLRMYPFDRQDCTIVFASYSANKDDIVYAWNEEDPVQHSYASPLPQMDFTLIDSTVGDASVTTSTATYSVVKAVFSLKRVSSYYVMTDLTPVSMLTIISLVALWMSSDKTNVKIGINILVLVAASFRAEIINNKLPFCNYTKAIDIWTGFHVMFIFISLVLASFSPSVEPGEEKEIRLRNFKSWPRPRKISFIARATVTASYVIFYIIYYARFGSA